MGWPSFGIPGRYRWFAWCLDVPSRAVSTKRLPSANWGWQWRAVRMRCARLHAIASRSGRRNLVIARGPAELSPSERGMPKWPRRWSRSTGLRLPARVTSVRLRGLSASTTAPRTLAPSSTSHTSVVLTMQRAAGVGGGDQVLPAAQVIGLADGVHLAGSAMPSGPKRSTCTLTPSSLVNGLPGLVVGTGEEAGGRGQHGAIEREARFDGGLRAQLSERRRHPFQNRWAPPGRDRRLREPRWALPRETAVATG